MYFDFCFEPADAGSAASIFGFSEYLAALALLLVVFAISDFRLRYRLRLTRYNVRNIAFLVSLVIGGLILLVDVWFHNRWLIPVWWNDSNNIKAGLGSIFLSQVFYIYFIVFLKPPVFSASNSKAYFNAMYYTIGRGNPDQLAVVADELGFSAKNIIELAAKAVPAGKAIPEASDIAHDVLLLLADKKFCSVMVDKSPWVVAELFFRASGSKGRDIPFGLFARNAGQQLVLNENSALHYEDTGYDSGFFGFTKPISTTVFGNFNLVEELARKHESPLDLRWYSRKERNSDQFKAYARAAKIFIKAYFDSAKKRGESRAFQEILESFKWATMDLYKLNGADGDFQKSDEFGKLETTVRFISDVVALMDEHEINHTGPIKPLLHGPRGRHDQIAHLIVDVIIAATSVKEPVWTCWTIQHNTVWSGLFSFSGDSTSWKVIRFKVRRLLYEDIEVTDTSSFFQDASILGLCLNIFGFGGGRGSPVMEDFYPLKRVTLAWAKRNYLALLEKYPPVAQACILGSISFDPKTKRLIKTYHGSMIGKEPARDYLDLEEPNDKVD